MPVILPEAARRAWLDPTVRDERGLLGLLEVFPDDARELVSNALKGEYPVQPEDGPGQST